MRAAWGDTTLGAPGIEPFAGGVVRASLAPEVVSPPYDALTVVQRAEVLARRPSSYLGVLAAAEDVADGDHLATGRRALQRLLALDAFEDRPAAFYVCRLSDGSHRQTGLVAEVPVAWADQGQILGHEQTRAERAADLQAHMTALSVTSSPVVFAHRHDRHLSVLLEELVDRAPLRAFGLDDGLAVELWAVEDEPTVDQVRRCLDGRRLYITDGHHRVEAARRHRRGREDRPGPHQYLLGALFAEEELRVEAFHRIVSARPADLLERLTAAGQLVPTEGPAVPHRQGSFAVTSDDRWYRLDVAAGPDELAPSVLQRSVLAPVFGVVDPTRDRRLVTVPGTTAPAEVARQARELTGAGFLLHPVSVAQLMVTADQGRTLPPKSTYFVPKMRSGIFLRRG